MLERIRESLLNKGYIIEKFEDSIKDHSYTLSEKFYKGKFRGVTEEEKGFINLLAIMQIIDVINKYWVRDSYDNNMDIMQQIALIYNIMSKTCDVQYFIYYMLEEKKRMDKKK